MIDFLQTLTLGLLLGGVYALFASGLTLVFGVMRIVNIAHSALIIMAAFASYYLNQHLGIDPIVSMLFNIPVMFVVGMLIYRLLLARDVESPQYTQMTVLLTFSLALMIEGLLAFLFSGTIRTVNTPYAVDALFIGDIFIPKAQLYAGLISLSRMA